MNSKKAQVPLTLDGNVLTLRYDMNALAELEDDFQKPIHTMFGEMKDNMGVSMMRRLLFHGLQAHQPGLTIQMVGSQMDLQDMEEYGTAVARALALAISGKEPSEIKKEKEEKEGDDADASDPPKEAETETVGTGTG